MIEYAEDLEKKYSEIGKSLLYESEIKKSGVSVDRWKSATRSSLKEAVTTESFLQGLEKNIIENRIKLYDSSNNPIRIAPYTGKPGDYEALLKYVGSEILPIMLMNLGMIVEGSEGFYQLNDEANGILHEFEALISSISQDPAKQQELMNNEASKLLIVFIEKLKEKNTDSSNKLKDILLSMGAILTDKSLAKMRQLVSIPVEAKSEAVLSLRDREIEIHFKRDGNPQVLSRNLYTADKYAKGTTIEYTVQLEGLGQEEVNVDYKMTLTGKTSDPEFQEMHEVIKLAGFKCQVEVKDTANISSRTELALVRTEIRPMPRTAFDFEKEFQTMDDIRNEIFNDSVNLISRLRMMCSHFKIPPAMEAVLVVKRAIQGERLLALCGREMTGKGVLQLLLNSYNVSHYRDLPIFVRQALNDSSLPDLAEFNESEFRSSLEHVGRTLGQPGFGEVYLEFSEKFKHLMGLNGDEWNAASAALPSFELSSSLEMQINFLGLHKLDMEQMKVIMNAALWTGIVKGTDPLDMSYVQGFLERHAPQALGFSTQSQIYEELSTPLSIEIRNEIQEMKVKEMTFGEQCLFYDKNISHFSEKFRERVVKLLDLAGEFRREVENPALTAEGREPLPTTIEGMAEKEFSRREPFQGDYYQGSIPISRIPRAIRDPSTNFRTQMWICANMDDFFEHFFIGRMPDGTPRIDAFEKFLKEKHPEINWLSLDKMRAQFEISKYVTSSLKHRRELDEQEGLSIFHPRHPLTTHSRETGVYFERVQRTKVDQTIRMQEDQQFEVYLRKHDISQQNIIPLSLDEIERHQPELYQKLASKYDLDTDEGTKVALKDPLIVNQAVIQTKWGSGGCVWAMNEGTLISKETGDELPASPVTMMLTRTVPMIGGISGHVEFIEHLTTYFGLDRQDALISTFANLVLCNAHSVPEVVLGSSGFIDLLPIDVMKSLEFNKTMYPTLCNWILSRVPKDHPQRKNLERITRHITE